MKKAICGLLAVLMLTSCFVACGKSDDAESEPMLEIIFGNMVYDIGYFYQLGTINKDLIYALRDRNANFTSLYEKKAVAAQTMLKTINSKYALAVETWKTEPAQ